MKHLLDKRDFQWGYTVCGIHRAKLEPKTETRTRKEVTCKNCKRAMKGKRK